MAARSAPGQNLRGTGGGKRHMHARGAGAEAKQRRRRLLCPGAGLGGRGTAPTPVAGHPLMVVSTTVRRDWEQVMQARCGRRHARACSVRAQAQAQARHCAHVVQCGRAGHVPCACAWASLRVLRVLRARHLKRLALSSFIGRKVQPSAVPVRDAHAPAASYGRCADCRGATGGGLQAFLGAVLQVSAQVNLLVQRFCPIILKLASPMLDTDHTHKLCARCTYATSAAPPTH